MEIVPGLAPSDTGGSYNLSDYLITKPAVRYGLGFENFRKLKSMFQPQD